MIVCKILNSFTVHTWALNRGPSQEYFQQRRKMNLRQSMPEVSLDAPVVRKKTLAVRRRRVQERQRTRVETKASFQIFAKKELLHSGYNSLFPIDAK